MGLRAQSYSGFQHWLMQPYLWDMCCILLWRCWGGRPPQSKGIFVSLLWICIVIQSYRVGRIVIPLPLVRWLQWWGGSLHLEQQQTTEMGGSGLPLGNAALLRQSHIQMQGVSFLLSKKWRTKKKFESPYLVFPPFPTILPCVACFGGPEIGTHRMSVYLDLMSHQKYDISSSHLIVLLNEACLVSSPVI